MSGCLRIIRWEQGGQTSGAACSLLYWCSIMAFSASSSDFNRSWLLSLASRNEGEDMEEKSCISLVQVTVLMPSSDAATLLITASKAGYTAESLPWLVVIRL